MCSPDCSLLMKSFIMAKGCSGVICRTTLTKQTQPWKSTTKTPGNHSYSSLTHMDYPCFWPGTFSFFLSSTVFLSLTVTRSNANLTNHTNSCGYCYLKARWNQTKSWPQPINFQTNPFTAEGLSFQPSDLLTHSFLAPCVWLHQFKPVQNIDHQTKLSFNFFFLIQRFIANKSPSSSESHQAAY